MTYELLAAPGPQPRLFKTSSGHDICQFHKPVDFECEVEGKILTASLTHAEDDKTRWLYHVGFSDGHKAVFAVNKKLRCMVEAGQDTPSAYAKAINNDLLTIYQFNPLHPPFCLSVNVKGEFVKVWVKRVESGCWFVAFKGEFRFFLHFFSGSWQPEPLDPPHGYLVPEITQAVTERLQEIIRFTFIRPSQLQAGLSGGGQA